MPWAKLDCHWYRDPDIQAAAEEAGSLVFSVFPVLLADAKAQADGGRVEFTYRDLSHALFAERESVAVTVRALVSAGVLSCPESSERGATLAFAPEAWRRWNDTIRKAESRNGSTPHE